MNIAAVQAAPVFLDRDATIDKVATLTAKAAADGAALVVFPESFVPTYPDWVWRTKPWDTTSRALHQRLHDQAVVVGSAADRALGAIAREHAVHLAVGATERGEHGGTLYNTVLLYGPDGTLLLRHRKVMPTGGERLVWGSGDASTIRVVDTPVGRVGTLICWENYMPLARAALYAQGVTLYLAPTWDNSDSWVSTLRHIAKEGRTFVVGVNSCLRGSDVPASVPGRDEIYGGDDDWMSRGNTTIVAPGGEILAGPLVGEEGILIADVDPQRALASRQEFDAVGHYSRPDLFRLVVDTTPRSAVELRASADDTGRTDP